jgi:serine/threonine-protein phosphatase 5
MNSKYSFSTEVHKKYSRKIYEMFESIFEYLPLVTLVEKEIFIVHGGKMEERRLNRRYLGVNV